MVRKWTILSRLFHHFIPFRVTGREHVWVKAGSLLGWRQVPPPCFVCTGTWTKNHPLLTEWATFKGLWEILHCAPALLCNFHVVKDWRLTTCLFWQEGWGYKWSATGHNPIQRSPSRFSLLICTCDRFTGLFQVGDFYSAHTGWELWPGVLAQLLKGVQGKKYDQSLLYPIARA